MKILVWLFCFLSCVIDSALARPVAVSDHQFVTAIIEDLAPRKFDIIKLYDSNIGAGHHGINLKPSQVIKMKNAEIMIFVSTISSLQGVAAKDVINFANCSFVQDDNCKKDKHFWLTPSVTAQIYKVVFERISQFLNEEERQNSRALIDEIASLKPIDCSKLNQVIYTDHAFNIRLASWGCGAVENIFDDFGNIKPSMLKRISSDDLILAAPSANIDRLKKIGSGKIIPFDSDASWILAYLSKKNKLPPQCKSAYCGYWRNLLTQIEQEL